MSPGLPASVVVFAHSRCPTHLCWMQELIKTPGCWQVSSERLRSLVLHSELSLPGESRPWRHLSNIELALSETMRV